YARPRCSRNPSAQVLRDSDFPGIVIGIHLDEFRKATADRPELRDLLSSPYAACFHWVAQSIINLAIEAGSNERIAFDHEANDLPSRSAGIVPVDTGQRQSWRPCYRSSIRREKALRPATSGGRSRIRGQ